jgi:hypothetical protein
MAMDWTHPEETTDKHHSPGPDLEPSGEEKERPTQEHLEKGPGGRHQADRLLLGELEWIARGRGQSRAVVDGLRPTRGSRLKLLHITKSSMETTV